MWDRFINWLKREPTILTQSVGALLGLAVAFDLVAFSEAQTGAVLAVVAGLSALFLAITVRPFNYAVIMGLVQAVVVLLVEFGLEFSDTQVAGVYTGVSVIGLLLRQVVTPETKLPAINGGSVSSSSVE
jgi:hypothetical protein